MVWEEQFLILKRQLVPYKFYSNSHLKGMLLVSLFLCSSLEVVQEPPELPFEEILRHVKPMATPIVILFC